MVAAVFEDAVVAAAGHGRHEADVVGVEQPDVAPAPLAVLVEEAGALAGLGVAFAPGGLHHLRGGFDCRVGGGDGVVQAFEIAAHP